MEKPLLLRPEYIFFDIYQLIWQKKRNDPLFSFILPDSILFQENKPIFWVFTSKTGVIKRKIKDKLTFEKIIKKFNFKKKEVIAYYFYNKEKQITMIEDFDVKTQDNYHFMMQFLKENDIDLPNEKKTEDCKRNLRFEFFDTDKRLLDFLENFNKKLGILQLFIKSNQDPNTMFRIFWTPKSKIYDMRRSRKALHRRVHFYEKCVTYETEKFNINTELIKSTLVQTKLERATLEIVEQLESIYKNTFKIKSIILHFKEGQNEQLYFAYCTGIYLVQYESKEKNNSIWKGLFFETDLSEKFYFDITKNQYEKDYNLTANYNCIQCNKLISSEHAKIIDYKSIIKYEKMLRLEKNTSEPTDKKNEILKTFQNKCNQPILIHHYEENNKSQRQNSFPFKIAITRKSNSLIPHAIRNVQPKMTVDKFNNMKDDVFFKDRKAKVCEDCFLDLSKFNYFTQAEYLSKVYSEKIRITVKPHELFINDVKSLKKLSSSQEIRETKTISSLINTPKYLSNSNNSMRIQSAVENKISSYNRTRNISTPLESKTKSSFIHRSSVTGSAKTYYKTNYTNSVSKEVNQISNIKHKPKIISEKSNSIQIFKRPNSLLKF